MLKFKKYEGAGNDFIMIDNLDGLIKLEPDHIARICDRHFGIGADGVILLEKSDKADLSRRSDVDAKPDSAFPFGQSFDVAKADCFMNYYNSDGTIAEMCGNGARCTAKFFLEITPNQGLGVTEINLETRAGIKNIKINEDNTFSVDMGIPLFQSPDFPPAIGKAYGKIEGYDFNFVSMGNPHAVSIVDNLDDLDIKEIGPKVETNPLFPNKINVEFIEKIRDDYYKVKVWERGCGATLACGTGACAVFAILSKFSARQGLAENDNEIILEFPGGKLFLSSNEQGHVILRGPANYVFEGEL